jgi:hypothetical protein
VLYTVWNGGGSQGTLSGTETYADGYHVFCKQIIDGNICGYEVDFYQTGSFTAVIFDIEPINHVKLYYSYKRC